MHLAMRSLRRSLSLLLGIAIPLFLVACNSAVELPILGERSLIKGDTLYHTIAPFSFINQEGEQVSDDEYKNQVYIADFFFTTCPGICPVMTSELTRVQRVIKEEGLPIKILSHTVDPETDQVEVLKAYGQKNQADFKIWQFVRGTKKQIYDQALSYLVVAMEDTTQQIPFVHSDKLVLVDDQGRIRGMYSGIDPLEVDQLIEDMINLTDDNGR